jgi:phospholipase C
MIEWRFGLAALTPRDAAANNLAEALDLAGTPDLTADQWVVPPVVVQSCAQAGAQPLGTGAQSDATSARSPEVSWGRLRQQASERGWRLP